MASETQVLPKQLLNFESFVADLVVVPIQDIPSDERACHICTEPYQSTIGFTAINVSSENPVRLACGHVFGKDCIAIWLARSATCPLCRRQLFKPPWVRQIRLMSHDPNSSPEDRARSVASPLEEDSGGDSEATEGSLNLVARGTTVRRLPRPRDTWSTEWQGPVHAAERMVRVISAQQQETAELRPIERPREEHGSGPTQGVAAARSGSRAVAPPRQPRTFADIDSLRASIDAATAVAQSPRVVPVETPRTRTSVALLGRSGRGTRDSESHDVSTRASSRVVSSRRPAAHPRLLGRPLTRSMSRGNDLSPGL